MSVCLALARLQNRQPDHAYRMQHERSGIRFVPRLAALVVLVIIGQYLILSQTPASTTQESPYVAAVREAKTTSLSEAPPFVDVATIPFVPASDMFERGPIAGYAYHPPIDEALAPDTIAVGSHQLRVPARHLYRSQYYEEKFGPNSLSRMLVAVVQYPNAAWARYDLRYQDGDEGLHHKENVERITKFGRPIFAIGLTSYWASGDKLIAITGSEEKIVDAFIEAYLKRYPNTLEPEFDLPYLVVPSNP
jgi:hypothetical protein